MSAQFQVSLEEAAKFSKVWNQNGIVIILQPEALTFARDFANVVLNNFVQMCQAQAREAAVKAAEAQKPKIIMEGV